jgi:hypothetical protein
MAWAVSGNLTVAQKDVPSYSPALGHNWDARRSAYNWKASNWHKVRAAMTKLAGGSADMHVGFFGDSTLIGYNGASYDQKQSIPYRFGQSLAARLGCPYMTTGMQHVMAASGSVGDRWTVTGSFSTALSSSVNYLSASGAGTGTWVSPDQGTSIEFYYGNLGTGTFTYSVDGATAVGVTPSGASTVGKVTVSGLANGFHTLLITATSGFTFLFAARVFNPSIKALHIHNFGLGGSKANTNGTVGLDWNDTTSTGLGNTVQEIITASGLTMDAIVVILGNNDVVSSTPAATIITGLTNVRNYYPSVPFVFVHPPKVSGSSDTIFGALNTAFYTMCDSLDVPLLDWNDLASTYTSISGDGLLGADGAHPIWPEQAHIGQHLAMLFAGDLQAAGMSDASTRRVIEVSGAYPPRPNVPAGQVSYSGADQPTDWLIGDSWDDLP